MEKPVENDLDFPFRFREQKQDMGAINYPEPAMKGIQVQLKQYFRA